ncbi:MAG: DUF296 domain-containing protein [Candidatus Eisenbacteria bacterium]|nr:DUF296 domain-containing protein [Candidatus Eisenbacteria bacterium]
MKQHTFNASTATTHLLVFEAGDEVLSLLEAFARESRLPAAQLRGIGALERCELGFFDPTRRAYERFAVDEQVELLSLLGNVSWYEKQPRIHVHVVVGRPDGRTRGGHLLRATVRPTLELFVTELPDRRERELDPESGLPLLA